MARFDSKVGLFACHYNMSCGKKFEDAIAKWRRLLHFPFPEMEPLAKQESMPLVLGGK